MDTSSAETASSHTMRRGLVISARAMHDALALAAAEGVRIALHVLRAHAHSFEQRTHPGPESRVW